MTDSLISRGIPTLESPPVDNATGVSPHKIMLWDADSWTAYRKQQLKRLPTKGEGYVQYLSRVRGWKLYWNATWLDKTAATAAEKVFILHYDLKDILLGWKARIKFGGRCSCTDVVAHHGVHTSWPTLADFQKTAGRGCVRCWFIVQSIAIYGDRISGRNPLHIQVNIRSTSPKKAMNGDFSRLRVRWTNDGSVPTLEHHIAQPPDQWSKLELQLYASEDSFQMGQSQYYRQPPPARSDKDECFERIANWVDRCIQNHACEPVDRLPYLPTRVLDVSPDDDSVDMRLVLGSNVIVEDMRFVALSHCWGDKTNRVKDIPKTRIATLAQHLRQIDWDDLTPTFQDAVTVVRRLNLRYIWIDSLCIVQDDNDDFAREAAQMAFIYGQAHLVIAATRGATGDAGLFHNRPAAHRLCYDGPGPSAGSHLYVSEALSHEAFVTQDPHNFDRTPLFQRAWCFQERLLARRVVHFSADEIVFECGKEFDCECRYIRALGIRETFRTKTLAALNRDLAPSLRLELWCSVVEQYSACKLHYETDRLPALSGFAHLVSSPGLGEYCAGHWRNEMPSGLLWRAARPIPGSLETYRPSSDKYLGPTWSWISVRGKIEAHLRWHDAIEILSTVIEMKSTAVSIEDSLGAVSSATLLLAGPVFEVTLNQDLGDTPREQRACFMAPLGTINPATEQIDDDTTFATSYGLDDQGRALFSLDVPMIKSGERAFCLAVEKWHPRIKYGQLTCLVLRKIPGTSTYERLGVANCPGAWLSLGTCKEVLLV